MERSEASVHQRCHKERHVPVGHHNECRHRHLDLACGRKAQSVCGVMIVRAVLVRAIGVPVLVCVIVVRVRVDFVNEPDVLKQHM